MLKGVIISLAVFGFVFATDVTIDKNTSDCGRKLDVNPVEEYIVRSNGQDAGINCTYMFRGEKKDNCLGLCYALQKDSYFENDKVTLEVDFGGLVTTFSNRYLTMAPWCSETMDLSLTLMVANDYTFDPKNPLNTGYAFSLAVYNRCVKDGQEKSITFEEAVKNLENYHHAEEFDDKVRTNMVHGILVGVLLACVFLVILLITYCYYKHSPNRGRSRSAGTPKTFHKTKDKMEVQKGSKRKEQPEEPHFSYKKTDPERVDQQKPESKPLLKGASADPEKPPV